MKVRMQLGVSVCCALVLGLVAASSVLAQSAPKPGLWQEQVSSTHVMALPPEVEAKIAAMPAAQQAQVRAMMGGAAGGSAPVAITRQACIAPGTTVDSMLSRAQQTDGMQCSFTNRSETANGASFDMSCTSAKGNAKGHMEFHAVDADDITSTSHIVVSGEAQGGQTMSSTVDSTVTAKFVSADCGSVKPYTPPAAAH